MILSHHACRVDSLPVPESSSIGHLHRRWLPVMRTSSREDRGDDFDWIKEQFGSILLNCPIDVCKDLDYSALGHFALSSCVL